MVSIDIVGPWCLTTTPDIQILRKDQESCSMVKMNNNKQYYYVSGDRWREYTKELYLRHYIVRKMRHIATCRFWKIARSILVLINVTKHWIDVANRPGSEGYKSGILYLNSLF